MERPDYGSDTTAAGIGLAPGIAWHLDEDGQWQPEQVPQDVLEGAKETGELTIEGYRATVFEAADGTQWAQKTDLSRISAIAARIAGL